MRDILFKAKRKDNGEWIEGYYYKRIQGNRVADAIEKYNGNINSIEYYEIDPETLCQYTGLTDKNNNRIWENDIIKIHNADSYFNGKIFEGSENFGVIYYAGTFAIRDTLEECLCNTFKNNSWCVSSFYQYDIEVIGNIFDNSEHIKEKF